MLLLSALHALSALVNATIHSYSYLSINHQESNSKCTVYNTKQNHKTKPAQFLVRFHLKQDWQM